MSKFVTNEDHLLEHLLLGQIKFRFDLFTLRVSSLLSPLNDASGDIVDDVGSFQFSSEGEPTTF